MTGRQAWLRANDESGSVMILIIFFGVIVAGLITVIVDVSTVFLGQRELQSVADGAAATAAQQANVGSFYAGEGVEAGPGAALPLTSSEVIAAVDDYISLPAHRPHECAAETLQIVRAAVDGQTVDVTLTCLVPWPFVSFVVGDEVAGHRITLSAQARLVVRPAA